MQTDATFKKWLTTDTVPENVISDKWGLEEHTSILPSIREITHHANIGFISVLEQEVRSPLSIIRLSVEILKSHPPAKDSAIYLDIIERNAFRIDNIINGMLRNP